LPEGAEENHENLSQGPPEYAAGVLTTRSRLSVILPKTDLSEDGESGYRLYPN